MALSSCGQRIVGYAVVLWGQPGGPVVTGDVVGVVEEGAADKACLLSLPGEKNPVEFTSGRLRIFKNRREAEEYGKSISAYLTTWAFSRKQDPPPLPIRASAKASADALYKLRQGQVVKVIGRTEKKELIKPYEDYWYELVTDDGYTGWCFGHFLKVFTAEGDPAATAAKLASEDPDLDRILGGIWRPDWFREMMNRGMIDLDKFREDIGFFPEPAANLFRLVLPAYSMDFPYDGIERISSGVYQAGPGLRISVLDQERIMLNYRHNDQEVGAIFAVVEDDVAEVISKEQQRREAVFNAIRAKGSSLASSAYGGIRLEEGMRFTWSGFEKLVPSIIPAGAGNTGRVDFIYTPSAALRSSTDGVITFIFDQPGNPARPPSFLYSAAAGGLRLTSLAGGSFSDLEVVKTAISPIVIFFTQGQSP